MCIPMFEYSTGPHSQKFSNWILIYLFLILIRHECCSHVYFIKYGNLVKMGGLKVLNECYVCMLREWLWTLAFNDLHHIHGQAWYWLFKWMPVELWMANCLIEENWTDRSLWSSKQWEKQSWSMYSNDVLDAFAPFVCTMLTCMVDLYLGKYNTYLSMFPCTYYKPIAFFEME